MTKNTTDFTGGDDAALKYIKERGYASYSSLCNVRDCKEPRIVKTQYFDIGTEVHSRFLEKKKKLKLSWQDEQLVIKMVESLERHPVVTKIMEGAQVEQKFEQLYLGLNVLGYIDILPPKDIGDLKTTRHNNQATFAANMDFLQAALYLAVTKRKNFYYVGIQKEPPFKVYVFNVQQYPERLLKAQEELKYLIKYVKKKTGL